MTPDPVDLVRDYVGDLPYMRYAQAKRLERLITRYRLRQCLELGFFHGVSSAYIAAILRKSGGGHLTTIDLESARNRQPNIDRVLADLGLADLVTVHYEPSSYTWRLMKLLEQHDEPVYDFCYIGGGRSWDATGFGFLLAARLLKPGGWLLLNELDWTLERRIAGTTAPPWITRKSKDEITTPQIRKVWELLVKRHPSFHNFQEKGKWALAQKQASSHENGAVSERSISQGCCNICGGSSFERGPKGRLSITRKLPKCTRCGSLERHRIARGLFDRIRDDRFGGMDVLQFSRDASTNPKWFGSFELSVFGKINSLDLQKIDRPSRKYDIVVCNHVLEHVPDDRAALKELYRIVRTNGVVFLSVPDPIRRAKTMDWGFADDNRHGHFRSYGGDIVQRFAETIPRSIVLAYHGIDTVTGVSDLIYLICKSASRAADLMERIGPVSIAYTARPLVIR